MERLISISIGAFQKKYGDIEALNIAKRIGADAVDFNTASRKIYDYRIPDSPHNKTDKELIEYYSAVRKHADSIGIKFAQTHGRMHMYVRDEAENAAILENARRDLLVASVLGAPYCVMHSVTTGSMGADTPQELMRALNKRAFCDVLKYAKHYGIKIATETFGDSLGGTVCDFFGQWDEFIATYQDICSVDDNADWFFTCMDTGHTNKAVRFGYPLPAAAIRDLGSSLKCLHLNDNDGMTDQHKPLLMGNIDWNAVLDALDEIGYNGIYNMELALNHFGEDFEIEEAEFAIKILRHQFALRDQQ